MHSFLPLSEELQKKVENTYTHATLPYSEPFQNTLPALDGAQADTPPLPLLQKQCCIQ